MNLEFSEFEKTSTLFGFIADQVALHAKSRVKTQSASKISFVSNLATINIHRHTYMVKILPYMITSNEKEH